ncbi:MAG: ribosome biogenesis GTP-binding protein YihA/YsxC [Rhodospirillales bacterium]
MAQRSYDDTEREAGRLLFAAEARFVLGAAKLEQVPPAELPEVCFAGRSNVGKSSLINALTGRKALARTSNTPGRTQELNFFNLADRLMICDLPGYGFAKAPLKEVKRWQAVLRGYLRGRAPLRRAFVLVDARHGIKANDEEIMKLLDESAVVYQVILTKADKIGPQVLARLIETTSEKLAKRVAAHPDLLVTSSAKGMGIEDARAAVAELANPA